MKSRNALLILLLLLMAMGVAEAAPSIVTPTNNQNITADITARILTDQVSGNLTIWAYQTAWQIVSTNTSYMPANTEYNVTLAVTDLADGNWSLMAEVNRSGTGATNSSTLASIGFDDTSPTVTCTYTSRISYGKSNTISCTITDTGFSSIQGNATVNVKDRFTGTNTMTGSSGVYSFTYRERTEDRHDFTVTAYDDHGWSTSLTKTVTVLPESSREREVVEQAQAQATQRNTNAMFLLVVGAIAGILILLLLRRR